MKLILNKDRQSFYHIMRQIAMPNSCFAWHSCLNGGGNTKPHEMFDSWGFVCNDLPLWGVGD